MITSTLVWWQFYLQSLLSNHEMFLSQQCFFDFFVYSCFPQTFFPIYRVTMGHPNSLLQHKVSLYFHNSLCLEYTLIFVICSSQLEVQSNAHSCKTIIQDAFLHEFRCAKYQNCYRSSLIKKRHLKRHRFFYSFEPCVTCSSTRQYDVSKTFLI